MNNTLPMGLSHRERMTVEQHHTVPSLPPVFATAMTIGFIEQTCIEALRPYLTSEQRTVGTQ